MRRKASYGVFALLGLGMCAWLALSLYARWLPFPEALERAPIASVVVKDRGGQLLAEVRDDGKLSLPVTRSELPQHLVEALLAAEDKRFYFHPGFDVLAIGRAAAQALRAGRVVSGASTLTQQLARTTFARPKTLFGKIHELAVALRIESQLSKDQILTAYFNRVEFGPGLVGVGAAARAYFAKPVANLSLSEAAALCAIPRGPSLYNPKRAGSPVKLRRDRILRRLREIEPSRAAEVERALQLDVNLQASMLWPGAYHWARRTARGAAGGEITTTIDADLQRRSEQLVRLHATTLAQFGASAAAVLVVDNATGDVLSYVGSQNYFDAAGGQVDGVTAARQPGSALKPFVYAAALDQLGYTPATLIPDIPVEYRERGGVYAPRNYDGRFHGPVRLREALANSFNVPAVRVAATLGPGRLLNTLHDFGFASLDKAPEHYGVALALGDGEVQLEELVTAYRTLATGGTFTPLRLLQNAPTAAPRRVVTTLSAALIADILRDPLARADAFGRNSALEFTYPVAAKTGTSKGARDNWTIGFSEAVTVGVWVGNFDGKPMIGSSGVSGAGPLFHAVMSEVMRDRAALSHGDHSPAKAGAVSAAICSLSGLRAGPRCPVHLQEWFVPGSVPGSQDDMHVEAEVLSGALAPGCAGATPRIFERYPPEYVAWAREVGRPLLPDTRLLDCRTPAPANVDAPVITFPRDASSYRLISDEPRERQQLVFRVTASGAARVTYVLDDAPIGSFPPPFDAPWKLARGAHSLYAVTDGGRRSEVVRFSVD
jgi:penicillin-binding protein 1C